MNPARRLTLAACGFFLFFFAFYLHGLSPAFHPDDSPETIAAGFTLSVQHPPGYPLHSLLGRLACLAMPGSPAFRVNLLAAFFGAASLLLFAALIHALAGAFGLGRGAGAASAAGVLALAFSQTFWFQAGIAKGGVYTLNLFITFGVLLAFFRAGRGSRRALLLGCMAWGLGFAHHWTSQVVLAPALAALLIPPAAGRRRPLLKAGTLAAAGLAFIIPFSLYLYLPLRTASGAPMSWGEPGSLKGLWWIFTRSQYAGAEGTRSLQTFLALLGWVGSNLVAEFRPLGLLLLGLGWLALLRRNARLAGALLLWPASLIAAVCRVSNPPADSLWVIDPYLIPGYAGLCLGAIGLPLAARWVGQRVPLLARMASRPGARWLPWLPALLALCLIPLHAGICDHRLDFLGYDYTSNLLLSCPGNAVVYCEGDSNTAGPLFHGLVLGKRPDLRLVATVLVDYPWYQASLRRRYPDLVVPGMPLGVRKDLQFLADNHPGGPAVFTNTYTADWTDPRRLLPRGLVYRPQKDGQAPWSMQALQANHLFPAYELRGAFAPAHTQDAISQRLVTANYLAASAVFGQALLEGGHAAEAEKEFAFLGGLKPGWDGPWLQAGNTAYQHGDLEGAANYWRRALREKPDSAAAMADMGLYYLQRQDWAQALEYGRRSLSLDPNQANARQLVDQAQARIQAGGGAVQVEPLPAGQAWALRGDQALQAGKPDAALKAYLEAERLGLNQAGLERNLAVLLARKGREGEAAGHLEKAVALDPSAVDLRKYLASLWLKLGQPARARQVLAPARKVAPRDQEIQALWKQASSKPSLGVAP